MPKKILLIGFLLLPIFSIAQTLDIEFGSPDVIHFSPEDYGAFRQNWAITQDSSGILYFGNNSGVLIYNGVNWRVLGHLPVSDLIRNLYTAADGTVYYASENDFGYLKPDSLSQYFVQSLIPKIPKKSREGFGTIWQITEHNEAVYFQGDYNIFVFADDTVEVLSSETQLRRFHRLGNTLATAKQGEGLVSIKEEGFEKLFSQDPFMEDTPFISHTTGSDSILFISREQGVTLFQEETFSAFENAFQDSMKKYWAYRSDSFSDKKLAIATTSGGIYLITKTGELLAIYDTQTGLNTNLIYDVFIDREQNIWAATDDGIDQIQLFRPDYRIDERHGFNGLTTGIEKFNDHIYVGTTEGLYRINSGSKHVRKMDTPFPRVLDMDIFENELFVVSGSGLYTYDGTGWGSVGFLGVSDIISIGEERLVLIREGQLSYLIKNEDSYAEEKILDASDEYTFADVALFEDRLWVLTTEKQVLKLELNNQIIENYSVKVEDRSYVEFIKTINERLRVGTSQGLFIFDEEINEFVTDSTFNDSDIKNTQVSVVESCADNSAWFRVNRQIKYGEKEDGIWSIHSAPYQKIGYNEAITTIKCLDGYVWFGGSNGLHIVRAKKHDYDIDYRTVISGIYVNSDSLIYGGYGAPKKELILPYSDNELRFTYAAASYVSPERNQYQVKLEGFDQNWSDWTPETQKDYTNIPEGNYTFLVRSKNLYNVEGSTASIPFSVLPPWYRTWWAYLLYTFAISGILYIAYKIRINQILRVQRIRNSIASDLHDEVSATLSSISYFAQAIQSDKLGGDKNRFVNLIADSAGDAKEKITDIVWAINPEHDDWQEFLSKCRRFASDLLESQDMDYSLKIDEYIPGKLDMQLRQHLWLIFKEMVTNAVRHSEASQLDIILKYEDGYLQLVVQDNGKGMDVDRVKKGNGLVNIHKRADLIDAEISLKTSEGFGTRWRLKLSLK